MKLKISCLLLLGTLCISSIYGENIKEQEVKFTRTDLTGIGQEDKVMRRDPSDVIKVGDSYYVWYSKGPKSGGYNATVWYATSKDGIEWEEKGLSIAKGGSGEWDEASVFTPNILEAEGKFYLFFTGISANPTRKPDSQIGMAVSDSPDGPWVRSDANPLIKRGESKEDFDSHLIDDSCLIKRDGKYWMYFKGRQIGKRPSHTQMGLAIADKPEGPYIKHESNPVIPGNHEVLVWNEGSGVSAMIGKVGPEEITHSIMHAEDGVNFKKVANTSDQGPWAGGTYWGE